MRITFCLNCCLKHTQEPISVHFAVIEFGVDVVIFQMCHAFCNFGTHKLLNSGMKLIFQILTDYIARLARHVPLLRSCQF